MDKFTRDKVKQINKYLAQARYEHKHILHLLSKLPRSLAKYLDIAYKVYKATMKIKVLYVQIRIIKETPLPKYQSGAVSGFACSNEVGKEMVVSACIPNFKNPIQSVHISKDNRMGGIQFKKSL